MVLSLAVRIESAIEALIFGFARSLGFELKLFPPFRSVFLPRNNASLHWSFHFHASCACGGRQGIGLSQQKDCFVTMTLSEEAQQLSALLLALTQPDTQGIRQAEVALKPLLKNPRCVPALIEILKARGEQVQ